MLLGVAYQKPQKQYERFKEERIQFISSSQSEYVSSKEKTTSLKRGWTKEIGVRAEQGGTLVCADMLIEK